MAFCPKCGASVEGKFCPSCGTNVTADAPTPGFAPSNPSVTAGGLPENTASALCYVLGLITGILFLVMEPYSKNPRVKFHAFQSIFLHVGCIAFFIGIGFVTFIMPLALKLLIALAQMVVGLGIFLGWLFLMWKTYNGEKVVLPIIGPLAQQQAGQ